MSTALTRALQARPEEFVRTRSVLTTVVGSILAAVFYGIVIWTIVDFQGVRDFSEIDGDFGIYEVRANAAPYLAIPVGLLLAIIATRWAIARNGPWLRRSTGTPLRQLLSIASPGDDAYFQDLAAKVATGDPAVFAPLPYGTAGNVTVEIFSADADRVAFATVGLRRAGKDPHSAYPLTVIGGDRFDALTGAAAAGRLVRARGTTPLLGENP